MQPAPVITTEIQQEGLRLERLSHSRIPDLVQLHQAVYGPVDPAYYFRKYDTGYTGVSYVGYLAYTEEGLPIAYYGVIPCFVRQGEIRILAAQSADTMTDPRHRMKGLFVRLSEATFALCRDLNIRLLFGFPNQNSLHGALNHLNWRSAGQLSCFTLRVATLPLKKWAERSSFGRYLYKRYAHLVLGRLSQLGTPLDHSARKEGRAHMDRCEEYVRYRQYSQSFLMESSGARAWIALHSSLWIGDVEGIGEKNFLPLMRHVKRYAILLGVRSVQFHVSKGTGLHRLFSQHLMEQPSFHALFQNFGSAIDPGQMAFTLGDIDIF